ncbi:hypothetical protein D3C75_972840 [compost metagenome]
MNGSGLRFTWGSPFYPNDLAISIWNNDICYCVIAAHNTEGNTGRSFGGNLSACEKVYGSDDISVSAVLQAAFGGRGSGWSVFKAHYPESKRTDDLIVAHAIVRRTVPRWKAKISCFQKQR